MPAVYLPLLLSALALVMSALSFFYFKSYLKRRTGQERILAEFREEVDGILKSINETVDRDISLIEDREKNLNALLKDIEKRVKVYLREFESRGNAEILSAALPPEPPRKKKSGGNAYAELGKNRFRKAAREIPPPPAAAETETVPSAPPAAPSQPLPLGEQIRALVNSGLSAPLIASRLGISIAEAEFAAALMERRETR